MNSTMLAFWREQAKRGDTLKKVYAAINEKGYCIGWSINKKDARNVCTAKSGTGNGDFSLFEIKPVDFPLGVSYE